MRHDRGGWRGLASLALVGLLGWIAPVQADEGLWRALRSGDAVALLRHATAPGTGDPPGFDLNDCATQRNLSPAGRAQARRIGEALRRHGVVDARVWSSRWCRCLETARLLAVGAVRPLPLLDSFFAQSERGPGQTAALRDFLRGSAGGAPRLLVTHQVNITALTGIVPQPGEMIVIRPMADGAARIMGRLALAPAREE